MVDPDAADGFEQGVAEEFETFVVLRAVAAVGQGAGEEGRVNICNLCCTNNKPASNRVQDVHLEFQNVQFLYADNDFFHFMNTETYEQP